jgi:hypothetical protein
MGSEVSNFCLQGGPDFEEDCDLLLIMGTSLKVSPFNVLPGTVKPQVPRVLFNREKGSHKFTAKIKVIKILAVEVGMCRSSTQLFLSIKRFISFVFWGFHSYSQYGYDECYF